MKILIDFLTAHWILSSLFVTLLVFYAIADFLYSHKNNTISAQLAIDLINHQNAVVIDLRTKETFEAGHIINAVNIPLEQLEPNLNKDFKKLQKYEKKLIIFVCDIGKNAEKLISKLQKQDFQQVFQLQGGMQEWVANGLPIIKGTSKND